MYLDTSLGRWSQVNVLRRQCMEDSNYRCRKQKSESLKTNFIADRYVLMGNHRDAWSVGAVDPTSGTAIMMEISRVLASLVKQGLFLKTS